MNLIFLILFLFKIIFSCTSNKTQYGLLQHNCNKDIKKATPVSAGLELVKNVNVYDCEWQGAVCCCLTGKSPKLHKRMKKL